jgi:L-ascorbate metabolism protein UlaG (beta-lactamase superfamily)
MSNNFPVKDLWAVVLTFSLTLALALSSGCAAIGASPTGDRQDRIETAPEWRDGKFRNAQPLWTDTLGILLHRFDSIESQSPDKPIAVQPSDGRQLAIPPSSGLRVTWFGHSSTLIEIDGVTVLTDPLWTNRISPVSWAGPKPWYAPPIALNQLPEVNAVVISHDHYDHLDYDTVVAMKNWKTVFVVPLGLGAHLERWGIPPGRIVELTWWQSTRIGNVNIVSTPARHGSGRLSPHRDQALWSGFAIIGPQHRAYYSGDTGPLPALQDIGERYGPFDVALIEAGQYDVDWPDWHLGPEQAVETNRMVKGKILIPVHWGLFSLARHSWTEPVERVLAAAHCTGTAVMTPRPGESVEPSVRPIQPTPRWWPLQSWRTASERPIIATKNGNPNDRVSSLSCGTELLEIEWAERQ